MRIWYNVADSEQPTESIQPVESKNFLRRARFHSPPALSFENVSASEKNVMNVQIWRL